jgi:DNA mismatch repair protein MutS2
LSDATALARLDRYLDDAFRSGLPSVRIIHGHGAGILRQQVRGMLADHPLVKSFAAADPRAAISR